MRFAKELARLRAILANIPRNKSEGPMSLAPTVAGNINCRTIILLHVLVRRLANAIAEMMREIFLGNRQLPL